METSKNIYLVTAIISVALMASTYIGEYPIFTILSNIGCSGIAAAIMAFFLDRVAQKKEVERKAKARAVYFRELKEQLKMMIERILWFDQRMDEPDFDWDKDPATYSSFLYMLFANHQYPEKEKISFQEAESRLSVLQERYSREQQEKMSQGQLYKVQRMFLILYTSSLTLTSEVNSIKKDKLELDAEDYLSLEEIDELCRQIAVGIVLMGKPNKNYATAIKFLISAYKTICRAGNYTDEIRIGLHGSITANEI